MNVPANFGECLALLNAFLNGTAGVLVTLAFFAVRRKDVVRHRKLMLSAVYTSAAFLVSYLTRMIIAGDKHFEGQGTIRSVFFVILITHVILAIAVVPLVLRAVLLATRGRLEEHRKLVRYTLPIWLYVSVTGVVVYLMLYQWPVSAAVAQ